MNNSKDLAFLEMAYGLAEKARGRVSPNPLVGALVVRAGAIVGHGYHEEAGKPHAEVIALGRAGGLAKKATAYITLEPCVHWGRTPPCADSLLRARLKRVVVSALDPNPLVYRKGIRKLKQAGVDVSLGLLQEKNSRLNETYIKYITQKLPFVTLKAALTLDGRMATRRFDSRWISSPATREYVHLLRGEYDAIMVGIQTVLHDDPLLTLRHPNWGEKRLTRIILDSRLRFPLKARMLSTLGEGKLIIFTLDGVSTRKAGLLTDRGVEVVPLRGHSGMIDLHDVMGWLGRREVSSLLVEGGSRLMTSLLEQKLADKVYLTVSPKITGGDQALPLLGGRGVDFIKDSIRLKNPRSFRVEEDIIIEGYL